MGGRVNPGADRLLDESGSRAHRPTISAILITHNEEEALARALESVRWVDEIVVVDSGSTDRTEAITRCYTDRFYFHPWPGYGKQKQHALELATREWIFVLDADEEVTPELRASIEHAVANPGEYVGFEVERHTIFLGQAFGSRGWWRDRKRRLFLRNRGGFSDSVVHEATHVYGAVGRLQGALLHHHVRGIEYEVDRLNRYTSLMAGERFARGRRSGLGSAVMRGTGYFLKSYLLRGGVLYGRAGFVDATFSGITGYLKHAKLWELSVRGIGDTKAPRPPTAAGGADPNRDPAEAEAGSASSRAGPHVPNG